MITGRLCEPFFEHSDFGLDKMSLIGLCLVDFLLEFMQFLEEMNKRES
jgi:hypothetical protein